MGRFISPDSIVPAPRNPQSLNRFSYVLNSPVNLVDPSGHSWLSKFLNRVVKPWVRIEVPVGTSIADAVCSYYFPWAIPLINAAAGAVNAWAHGESGRQIYQSAARGFAVGVVIAVASVAGHWLAAAAKAGTISTEAAVLPLQRSMEGTRPKARRWARSPPSS